MITVTTSEDYYLQVLRPNFETFMSQPSTFANAINLSTSLYHFHEWLHAEYRPVLEARFGLVLDKPWKLWKHVEAQDVRFGYIRDLTNASKHVSIGGGNIAPSTGMTHIANTSITSGGYGTGGYGQRGYGNNAQVKFDDMGATVDFDMCATALHAYWKQLLEALTGKVFI